MSKRQELREKHKKQQKQQRLIIIIMVVVGALLIASALILPSLQPVGTIAQITPRAITATVKMTSMGNTDAPVKVDVWEDFQCPGCKQYSQQFETQIVTDYVETGKVFYTFHHYPFIDSQTTTKESHQAANASMCAAAQGRFWDYHDMLFANWIGENVGAFSNKRLVAFAQALNLNMSDFKACFNQNQYATEIEKDYTDANDKGVTGTPTIFVNGIQTSIDVLFSTIDSALSGK
jgi:protein-disulfide isomerase